MHYREPMSTGEAKPTGEQLVEWTERDFPHRTPGTRSAHTVGIGVSGTFRPAGVMAEVCSAPQFNSGPVPILARFSNGSGLNTERDLHTDARGLAVKLLPGAPIPARGEDPRFDPGQLQADMVAMTLPLFFVRDGATFEQLSEASIPVPVSKLRLRWWQRVMLDLRLQQAPAPPPADVDVAIDPRKLTKFATAHPEANSTVAALSGLINPTSYGRASYHGVHAFVMTDPRGGVRFVRYQWEPLLGVRGVTEAQKATLADNHLHVDLRRRLQHDTIKFSLELLVGEEGDDPTDPTTPWPVQRPRISAGILTLDHVLHDQSELQERLSYNPTRTLSGFEPVPGDELITARGRAYEFSCGQRGGSGCPVR